VKEKAYLWGNLLRQGRDSVSSRCHAFSTFSECLAILVLNTESVSASQEGKLVFKLQICRSTKYYVHHFLVYSNIELFQGSQEKDQKKKKIKIMQIALT
jgi:hypothetical protein